MKLELKQLSAARTVSWRIDAHSKPAQASAALMAAFAFLRAVYYFGTADIASWGAGALIFELILPGLLALAFAALLRAVYYRESLVYGILSGVFCLFLVGWGLHTWGGFWGAAGTVWYLLTAALLAGTVLGYVEEPLYLTAAFFIPPVLRLLVRDLGQYVFSLKLIAFLPEASILCLLCGLGCFSLSLRRITKK